MNAHFASVESDNDSNANIGKNATTSTSIASHNCNITGRRAIPSKSLPDLNVMEEIAFRHEFCTTAANDLACSPIQDQYENCRSCQSYPKRTELSPKPSDNRLMKPKKSFQRSNAKHASDTDIQTEQSGKASKQSHLLVETTETRENMEQFDAAENKEPNEKRNPDPPRRQFLDHLIIGGNRHQARHYQDLMNPAYKSRFLSKVMAVKVVKWMIASVLTMVTAVSDSKELKKFPTKHVWTVSVPLCGYFGVFVSIRLFNVVQKNPWVALLLILQILCISYAAYAFHCIAQSPIMPMILLTLIWTYLWIGILSAYEKMDLTQDSAIPLVLVLILSFSVIYYLLMKFAWLKSGTTSIGHEIGTVWLPTVMMMQSLTLMEMAELKALIEGYRTELGPTSYLIVGTFLV